MSSNKREEHFLDSTLRPTSWDDYIGQADIKANLRILLRAAGGRGEPPEHLLFYGAPGLGKTTLAHLVAREIGAHIQVTSGPAIEKVGDLASILTNLSPGDILFIDEVHRLNRMIEEVLYPAMESGLLNIVIGKGPGARSIQLELPPFTLVAATTRMALLSSPLRSRFSGGTFKLDFYTEDEVVEILQRSAARLGTNLAPDAAREIAKRSRSVPRLANQYLKRCRDYAEVKGRALDLACVREALALLGIDELGLLPADKRILEVIISKFRGGPVGLTTLATAVGEEESSLLEVHEPYLIQLGLIERTPRGRVATHKTFIHLGHAPPAGMQKLIEEQ